jgi:hypothetical protein
VSRRSSVLVAALLSTAACTEPAFGRHPPEQPLNHDDAGTLDTSTARVDAGTHTPPPVVSTPDGGLTKPGLAAPAVFGGLRTGSQPSSAGNLTLQEDGFDTGETLCVDKLCATGRFEP